VGGAVRDGLLGRLGPRPDLDFVVTGDAIAVARQLARAHGGSAVVLDAEHNIARLVLQGWNLDLARCDGPNLEADLGRRDYTVNAIALRVPAEPGDPMALLDPTGGLAHLERRQLVAVSEANLLADPLRLLRGVRLAASLQFELEATSLGWIQRHAGRIDAVAGERVLAELEKLAEAPEGHTGLHLALHCGLLAPWQADATSGAALADLSLEQAQRRGLLEPEWRWALPLARLSALLPAEALAGLRSSRRLQQLCRALRRWRLELNKAGDWSAFEEARRLALHQELEADLPALLLLVPGLPAGLLERWRDPDDPLLHPQPPLDGRSLQQHLAIPAGPALGRLLHHLTLERAFGRLPCSSDPQATAAALAAARRWWTAQGLEAEETNGRRD